MFFYDFLPRDNLLSKENRGDKIPLDVVSARKILRSYPSKMPLWYVFNEKLAKKGKSKLRKETEQR